MAYAFPAKASMGKLALVASLWSAPDMTWLDGECHTCDLDTASFTISDLVLKKRTMPYPPFSEWLRLQTGAKRKVARAVALRHGAQTMSAPMAWTLIIDRW